MKKEPRLLLAKSTDSLILAIEQFNRPSDRGRVESVLIFLDHSFEMLLKAAILHKGGKIRKPRESFTIGFDESLRKLLSDGNLKCLTNEQALTLQTINTLRDAAQHHLVYLSEQHLYIHAQAGLSLYRAILKIVFGQELATKLPERVLPISTTPPVDIATLFNAEVGHIKELLRPGARKQVEALTKLRGLAILEGAIQGQKVQPGDADLRALGQEIKAGHSWSKIFPGVASIEMTTKGYGNSIDLKISKKDGLPVHIVPEGTPGASVVAIKRVDELGFYNLSFTQLAEKSEMTGPRTLALIMHLKLQDDPECYKEFIVSSSHFKRYSQKALDRIKREIPVVDMKKVWSQYGARLTKRKKLQ